MWKHVLHVCIIFLTVILYQSNAIEDFDSDSLPIDDDLWEKTNSGKPWLSNGRTRPQPVAKLEFEKPFRRLSEYYSSPNNNKWERNNKQGFNHFNKKPPMSINRKNNYESFSKANDDSFGPSFSSSGQRRPFALPSSSKSKNSFSSNLFDSQASFEKDNFFSNSPQDFMPEGDPQLVLDDNWYITRDVDYMSEGMKEVCRNLTKMCPAEFWQDQSQSSEMQPIKVPSKKIPSSYVSTNIRTRSMNTKNDFIRSVFSSSLDSAKNKIGKQLEIIDEIFLALNNNVTKKNAVKPKSMDNIHQLVSSLRMVQSLISKEQNSKKVSKVYRQKASPDWLEIQPRQSNPTTNPQTNIREGLQIISQLLANVKEDLLNFEKQVTIWNSEGTSMHSLVMMKNEMLKSIELLQAMHQFITKNRQNFLYSESKRMVDNLRKSAQSLQSQTVVLYTMSQEKSESLDVVSWFKIVKRWFKLKCLSMFNPISFKDLNFKLLQLAQFKVNRIALYGANSSRLELAIPTSLRMVKMGSQNVYTVIGQLVQPVYTRSYNDFELCLTENSQKRFEANFTLKLTSSFNFTMDLDQAMFSNFQFAVTDVEIEDLELGAMPKEAQKFITSLADSLEFTASDFVINFFNSLTLQLKSSRITLPFSALINLPPGSFTDADANIENFMTKNKMSLTTCSIDLLKGFEVEPISPSRPAVGAATTTIPTTSTTGRPRLTGPPVLARELDQPFELKEPIKAFRQDPEPETELSFDEFRTDHQSDYQKSKKQSYNNNIDSVKSFWSNGQFVPPQ